MALVFRASDRPSPDKECLPIDNDFHYPIQQARQLTMAWSHSFLLISAIGHAAVIGGGVLLSGPGPAVEPDAELFVIDAPEVVEQPAPEPEPEPEPPAAPRQPSPGLPPPVVKAVPPSPEPVPEQQVTPATTSDNSEAAPEVVAANAETSASTNGFVMRSGRGTVLGAQSPPTQTVLKPVPAPPKPVPVAALYKSWRTRVSLFVSSAAGRRYPDSARRLGNEGTVVLSMNVDSSGRVTSVEVVSSSGHGDLDQAAISAVRRLGSVPAPPPEALAALRPFPVQIAYRLQ